jgi:hypothetical protein
LSKDEDMEPDRKKYLTMPEAIINLPIIAETSHMYIGKIRTICGVLPIHGYSVLADNISS